MEQQHGLQYAIEVLLTVLGVVLKDPATDDELKAMQS
jgi:hypothetical protein